ncbi:MAG: glycosyltransferase [Clostridia bacterium]|nr:glycosyltransferase [Clostridia bacterium]
MKKVFMMVYNDITKDARVMRSADALSKKYDVYLYAIGKTDLEGVTCIPVKNCSSIGGSKAYAKFILGSIKEVCRLKPDLVYGHDIFSAIPFVLLKKLFYKNSKFIYDAHELFIFEKNKKYGFFDRLQYKYEAKAIKKADKVICAESQRAQKMVEYHDLKETPTVIKNISYLAETEDDSFKKEYLEFFDIPATSVVYAGGMLAGRQLDKLVEAVNNAGTEYKLMLIGDGPAYNSLYRQIDSLGNKNIRICKALPYAKLSGALKNFDIGYLYYGTSDLNNLYCAPNKIYEYAGIGLPILANENPTVKKIITESNLGVCTDDFLFGLKKMSEEKENYADYLMEFVKNNSVKSEKELLVNVVNEVLE